MRRAAVLWVAILTVLAGGAVAASSRAAEGVSCAVPAPPPAGPSALTGPAPDAPQLENSVPWEAPPLLVANTEGYDQGEYLYQDPIWDDQGASLGSSKAQDSPSDYKQSTPKGTYRYPTDEARYGNNAADLLEFRLRPEGDDVLYRVTLNSLLVPDSTAVTVAIAPEGAAPGPAVTWPRGVGINQPLGIRYFITSWGHAGELVDVAQGSTTPVAATVDLDRNQLTFAVSRQMFDPGALTWRYYLGVGLWDPAHDRYLIPQSGAATPTQPGGGSGTGPAFFNVGFRFHEPMRDPSSRSVGLLVKPTWLDYEQAVDLASGNIAPFHADIDFAKLANRVLDRRVPATGTIARVYPTSVPVREGIYLSDVYNRVGPPDHWYWGDLAPPAQPYGEPFTFTGALQMYALRLPPPSATRPGLTVALHGGNFNYFFYANAGFDRTLADTRNSVVLMLEARGGRTNFFGAVESDAFAAMADVRRHYNVDMNNVAVAGYSTGGWGAYKLGLAWPDVFGKAFSVAGPINRANVLNEGYDPENGVLPFVPAAVHEPFLIWNGTDDELVPIQNSLQAAKAFKDAGLRYTYDVFPGYEHLTFAILDQWQAAADWLGAAPVAQNPTWFTYVTRPDWDYPYAGVIHDHAYWVGRVRARDMTTPGGTARIDVRSLATGTAPPAPAPVSVTAQPGPPSPYVQQEQGWQPSASQSPDNAVDLALTNVSSAQIFPAAGGVDIKRRFTVHIRSDGPGTVELVTAHDAQVVHDEGGATATTAAGGEPALTLPSAGSYTVTLESVGRCLDTSGVVEAPLTPKPWTGDLPLGMSQGACNVSAASDRPQRCRFVGVSMGPAQGYVSGLDPTTSFTLYRLQQQPDRSYVREEPPVVSGVGPGTDLQVSIRAGSVYELDVGPGRGYVTAGSVEGGLFWCCS